ncbi:MAG: PRC-barrel domain-containing protein [Candidatus Marsarchaeota archaeon]|jgi:sporulation protein YlmC with PRC-barrel domain|nr:PRC-barrel domain-containing protein [Candidatus Marsarchaeota archaeon]
MKLSEIYNMDIYSDGGQYIGEVKDVILDLEKSSVSRLLMNEWKNMDKEAAKRVLQQKSVLFKNVKNVGDVVLVSIPTHTKPESTATATEVGDLTH